jgi:nucleotide-binding universal stress UspA family protein
MADPSIQSMADANEPGGELEAIPEEPKAILVALDASNGADRVLGAAARLSRQSPTAVLHVLHVYRQSRFDHARAGVDTGSDADFVNDAKEHLEAYVRSARRRTRSQVIGHFSLGDPTHEILRTAASVRADVLVIGTHDHAGFERLLLGSVAERLVRQAGCSVYVVRPTKHTH